MRFCLSGKDRGIVNHLRLLENLGKIPSRTGPC